MFLSSVGDSLEGLSTVDLSFFLLDSSVNCSKGLKDIESETFTKNESRSAEN